MPRTLHAHVRMLTLARPLWGLFLIAMKTYNVIYFAQIRKYFCIYRKNAVNLQRKYVIINHFKILTL